MTNDSLQYYGLVVCVLCVFTYISWQAFGTQVRGSALHPLSMTTSSSIRICRSIHKMASIYLEGGMSAWEKPTRPRILPLASPMKILGMLSDHLYGCLASAIN